MWQKVFENDAFCGIMHETAAEQKESRSPETPADIVILFILMNCMSQICGLWLNNAAVRATEAICLSVAIQFTQNFLGAEPECGQVCKFVKDFRPDLLGVRTARIEVPCKLVEVSAHLAALSKQSGNSGQSFFSAAGNDDCFLNLDVVDGTADKSGEGEI